jgi:hypothetical protein
MKFKHLTADSITPLPKALVHIYGWLSITLRRAFIDARQGSRISSREFVEDLRLTSRKYFVYHHGLGQSGYEPAQVAYASQLSYVRQGISQSIENLEKALIIIMTRRDKVASDIIFSSPSLCAF